MTRILVVGDLHVGNPYGIMPETVLFNGEHEAAAMKYWPNEVQEQHLAEWEKMIREVGHVDIVVGNGDLIDGTSRKEEGCDQWTTNVQTQVESAGSLMGMIDTDHCVVTSGSKYHTERNPDGDRLVAKEIGARFTGVRGFMYEEDDIRLLFRHKVGYSQDEAGRGRPLAREALVTKLNDDVYGEVDGHFLSHTHTFAYAGNRRGVNVSVPCWKWVDNYIGEKSRDCPDCGYVLVETNGKTFNWSHHIYRLDAACTVPIFRKGNL